MVVGWDWASAGQEVTVTGDRAAVDWWAFGQ